MQKQYRVIHRLRHSSVLMLNNLSLLFFCCWIFYLLLFLLFHDHLINSRTSVNRQAKEGSVDPFVLPPNLYFPAFNGEKKILPLTQPGIKIQDLVMVIKERWNQKTWWSWWWNVGTVNLVCVWSVMSMDSSLDSLKYKTVNRKEKHHLPCNYLFALPFLDYSLYFHQHNITPTWCVNLRESLSPFTRDDRRSWWWKWWSWRQGCFVASFCCLYSLASWLRAEKPGKLFSISFTLFEVRQARGLILTSHLRPSSSFFLGNNDPAISYTSESIALLHHLPNLMVFWNSLYSTLSTL